MVAVQKVSPSNSRSAYTNRSPSLEDAAAGSGYIRRGQESDSVRQLQQMLKDRGYPVTVDGKFGQETKDAVKAFQAATGARVDGVVGPETMGKLNGHEGCDHDKGGSGLHRNPVVRRAPSDSQRSERPEGTVRAGDLARNDEARRARSNAAPTGNGAVTLAPAHLNERERYDHYARIVRQNGGEVCADGKPTVLGIRGMSRDGSVHDTGSTRRYDDTFVVLTPDGRVREFAGATHPGQNGSTQSPDVASRSGGARDGVGDVGMIHAGNYRVVPNGTHAGAPSYHVRTTDGSGRLPGWRDTNHDGQFSDTERAQSDQRGDYLTGVLFHQGGSTRPSSIGCQTLSPSDYREFIGMLGPRTGFSYTLVDAYRG